MLGVLGVLGVNSCIGRYQRFPKKCMIVGLDLKPFLKNIIMLYRAVLSVPIDVFIRRRHDSVLPRNHKSNFLKKQETKEPGRHTLEKPGIPKPQKATKATKPDRKTKKSNKNKNPKK